MTNKWMLGTAMAAVLAATPVLAQEATTDFGECTLEEMTNETFLGLDLDDDSGLTMDEYRECLSENDIELDDEQMAAYEERYTTMDADADGVLIFAEVETASAAGDTAEAEAEGDAPEGTITVTQPAAEVVVEQPAADVTVDQPEPEVAVETQEPEVAVTTPEPEVQVEQAQPTVEVEQPEPTVAVEQPAPEVTVEQPEPEVAVEAGQPAVEVEATEPEVAVETPEPEVEVTQPDLDVDVEQEEADVAVTQEQADVAVQQTTEVEGEAAEVEAVETEAAAETEVAAVETEVEVEPTEYQITVNDIVGEDVYNTAGEEIGSIEEIVLSPGDNKPYVIVSVGGFLGLGDREVAFPYDDLNVQGEENIVLNTTMTSDEIKEMEEYDDAAYEPLPETMIVQ